MAWHTTQTNNRFVKMHACLWPWLMGTIVSNSHIHCHNESMAHWQHDQISGLLNKQCTAHIKAKRLSKAPSRKAEQTHKHHTHPHTPTNTHTTNNTQAPEINKNNSNQQQPTADSKKSVHDYNFENLSFIIQTSIWYWNRKLHTNEFKK